MRRLRKLTVFFILTFIALSQVSFVSAEDFEGTVESSSNESSSESSEEPKEPVQTSTDDDSIASTSETENVPAPTQADTKDSYSVPAKNKRSLINPVLVGTAYNPSSDHPSWGELGDYHNPNGYDSGVNISNVFRPGISSSGLKPQVYENGKVLTITKDQKSQLGAVWSKNTIDLTYDFAFRFDIYLGLKKNPSSKPASDMGTGDGMTFTFTNDPRIGTSEEQNVIGSGGKALGAYGVGSAGRNYVRNAISVEYDTFYNDDQDSDLKNTTYKYGHIGVVKPAEKTPTGHLAVTNSNYWLSFGGMHSDGVLLPGWRSMVVGWHAASRSLTIMEDGTNGIPPIVYRFKDEQEIMSTFGNSKEVYFGFTGSTGTLAQTNALMIREMPTAIQGQEATIQNITRNSSAGSNVTAQIGDKLEIKDSIKIKKNSFGAKNTVIEMTLPDGLEFDDQLNLRLNDAEIPETLYEVSGKTLKISNLNLENVSNDLLKENVIAFNGKVSNGAAIGTPLSANFRLTNPDALEVDCTSNDVSVTVENPPTANLVIHHKKTDTGSVETDTIAIPIGENFLLSDYKKATSDYQDYVYTGLEGEDSTPDETVREMTADGAEFTLLYKPKGEFKMTVPKIFNFGSHAVQQAEVNAIKPKGYEADGNTPADLIIKDTRYQKTKWTLSLAQSKPIQLESASDRKSLADTLYYSDVQINQNASVVESDTFTTDKFFLNISSNWTDKKGLMMKIPFSKQYKGVYTGELTWTYALAP